MAKPTAVSRYLLPLGISALLLMLAFPLPGWGWLAHVALVPAVILAVRAASTRRLAWTSYLVSLAWWLVMIRWLIPVTMGGYVGLSAYMAIYLPLTLLAVRYIHGRLRLPLTVLLPVVWVSLEFLRCTIWQGGFAWLALAHTQAPLTEANGAGRLIQIADIFGQWGVSFVVAMTNGLIADLLTRPLFRRQPGASGGRTGRKPQPNRTLQAACMLWLVTLAGSLIYGQWRITQAAQAAGPTVRIAVIQTNVAQDNKVHPTTEQMLADWQRLVELTQQAAARNVELIVWPETMVPAALNPQAVAYYQAADSGQAGYEYFHNQITELARQIQTPLLVGAHANDDWRNVEIDGLVYAIPAERYNAAFFYDADGHQHPAYYAKMHRVPFGEYVPYVDTLPWLKNLFIRYISPYDFDYSLRAGQQMTVFELPRQVSDSSQPTQPVRIVTPICFEDAVSQLVHRMFYGPGGRKQADLLVNLTNDGWFAGTHQPYQHLQLAVLRSVENRVPTARSVNTGISGFIDSVGRIGPLVSKNHSPVMVDGYASHDVTLDTRRSVFGTLGLIPVGVVTALAALLLAAAAGVTYLRQG